MANEDTNQLQSQFDELKGLTATATIYHRELATLYDNITKTLFSQTALEDISTLRQHSHEENLRRVIERIDELLP